MTKPTSESIVISNIFKNVNNKQWPCYHPGCSSPTINSHLLQKNGIISNISENGHVVEVKPDYMGKEKGTVVFNTVGVNKALSLPLFCNTHDTEIFKPVEIKDIDYNEYKTQLLFSYRATCGELRKKQNIIESYRRILNAHSLTGKVDETYIKRFIASNELGARDLNYFKSEFETHLSNDQKNNFKFNTLFYPKIPVCTSAIFSLLSDTRAGDVMIKQHKPWDTIFINLIPLDDKIAVIIGYHETAAGKLIHEHVKSWQNMSDLNLQIKISELIIKRVETWGLSPLTYKTLSRDKITRFKKLWDENLMSFYDSPPLHFNIFNND